MSGTIVTIRPDGEIERLAWVGRKGPTLDALQKAVGGYIEPVPVRFEGRARQGYVNEDGISLGLQPNPHAVKYDAYGRLLLGNLAIWVPDAKSKNPK